MKSHSNDGLADLLVRLQVAVGLDDLAQRKRLGDDRFQRPIGQALFNKLLARL
jgi:hypothetical protein